MARKAAVIAGARNGQGAVRQRRVARRQGGFTLFELLFVVALIAIIGVVATPTTRPGERVKLELAAAEVADAYRFARSEAIRRGEAIGVQRDVTNGRFRLFSMNFGTNPATLEFDVYHPIDKHPYERQLREAPFAFDGKILETPAFRSACDTPESTYFDANGTPWCADPADVLLDGLQIGLTDESNLRTVGVQPINGRVTIQ